MMMNASSFLQNGSAALGDLASTGNNHDGPVRTNAQINELNVPNVPKDQPNDALIIVPKDEAEDVVMKSGSDTENDLDQECQVGAEAHQPRLHQTSFAAPIFC